MAKTKHPKTERPRTEHPREKLAGTAKSRTTPMPDSMSEQQESIGAAQATRPATPARPNAESREQSRSRDQAADMPEPPAEPRDRRPSMKDKQRNQPRR